jgi:hypothetical protein
VGEPQKERYARPSVGTELVEPPNKASGGWYAGVVHGPPALALNMWRLYVVSVLQIVDDSALR